MVAVVIMTVGVLGLASTAALVSRLIGGAAQQTIAANVAESRFEQLRSMQCGSIKSDSAITRGIIESWTVTKAKGAIPGVTGLFDVVDVVRYTAADGRVRSPLVFRSYVQCN
jgi:Tfp pilus assembly protein PilV